MSLQSFTLQAFMNSSYELCFFAKICDPWDTVCSISHLLIFHHQIWKQVISNRYGILRKLVHSYSFHQKEEDMENLDGSPSLSDLSVCLSVLKALTNFGDTGKVLPPRIGDRVGQWLGHYVYNNDNQGQRKSDMRDLKILRATVDIMSKDSKDYF